MKLKIGFSGEDKERKASVCKNQNEISVPRKSVVQVRFADRNISLAYYNDMFDLRIGDFVYVEGKLEGQRGRVIDVNYNFKIKLSDYKRVIALVDTTVKGKFCVANTHFISFDRHAIPMEKVLHWYKAPAEDEDKFVSGSDDSSFELEYLSGMKITSAIVERGREYYVENRVVYISVDGNRGYAIVQGNEAYEIEFEYHGGVISRLTCSCFCNENCKHEFAAMLQLREIVGKIKMSYASEYERSGYFAAICKGELFFFAVDGNEEGSFVLN